MGEFDVEACNLQRAFGLHLGGVRGLQGLTALIDHLLGNGAALHQAEAAIELALGELHLRPCIRQLAFRLRRHRLEWTRVDDIEQVALMHDGAVLEFDRVDEAADPRTHLHLLGRLEAPGELVPIGDGALDRLGDRHRRRRWGSALRGWLPATCECE